MRVIHEFDPWKFKLCTCPKKYSLNPYTGCAHGCLYCYAASFIPRFREVREKWNLLRNLERDLNELPRNSLISMSNSSDPYPPIERDRKLTRACIKLICDYEMRLLVITKSDIVTRDIDLLSQTRCAVAITVTGFSTRVFEPRAPSPEKRIEALRRLHEAGIPTILRLDPIMPWIKEEEIFKVLEKCSFVDHVVASTLKLKPHSFKEITTAFPRLKAELIRLYFVEGEKIGASWYLPKSMRVELLRKVESWCKAHGISVAFCREGIDFKAKSCDGSHLIR